MARGALVRHEKQCVNTLQCYAQKIFHLGWDSELKCPADAVAAGMDDTTRRLFFNCKDRMIQVYENFNQYVGLRPAHVGKQYACGGNPYELTKWFGPGECSQHIAERAKALLGHLLQTPLVEKVILMSGKVGLDTHMMLPELEQVKPGGNTVVYFGDCYSPVSKHAQDLQKENPLHLDSRDYGLTIFAFWQDRRTPIKKAAHFHIQDKVYPITGGVIVILHARHVKHGIKIPVEPDTDHFPWYGIACVRAKQG